MAVASAGHPIRCSPGDLVANTSPNTPATAFYLVTVGEVLLLPASLQISASTTQLDVFKVRLGSAGACSGGQKWLLPP